MCIYNRYNDIGWRRYKEYQFYQARQRRALELVFWGAVLIVVLIAVSLEVI